MVIVLVQTGYHQADSVRFISLGAPKKKIAHTSTWVAKLYVNYPSTMEDTRTAKSIAPTRRRVRRADRKLHCQRER